MEATERSDGEWLTNPVLCLREKAARILGELHQNPESWTEAPAKFERILKELAEKGVRRSSQTLRWLVKQELLEAEVLASIAQKPEPRVVGLLVPKEAGGHGEALGLVSPLAAEKSRAWDVAATLPFSATRLQELVEQLFSSAKVPNPNAIPERLAFRVGESLGRRARGRSMDVAGLLAVIDAASERKHKPLRAACVVVEPDAKERDRLRPVLSIRPKLEAFVREYGRGSLLVASSTSAEVEDFRWRFGSVWQVETLSDLARELQACGLLEPFLRAHPLTRTDLGPLLARLGALLEEHDYSKALELAKRIESCGWEPDVQAKAIHEFWDTILDLYRHTGQHQDAIRAWSGLKQWTDQLGDAASFEDAARADGDYAASLYDAHRFTEIVEVLEPWIARINAEPRMLSAGVRVGIFNSLARAQVLLDGKSSAWEENLRRAMDLQWRTDRASLPRTLNYRIHGLLRHGRLDEADREITELRVWKLDVMSSRFLSFLKTELERQRRQLWTDPQIEQAPEWMATHVLAFYFQATARQEGRPSGEAGARFRRAAELFEKSVPAGGTLNVQSFLAIVMRLAAAAWTRELRPWTDALAQLKADVTVRVDGLADYYGRELRALPSQPSRVGVERLLLRVPYF